MRFHRRLRFVLHDERRLAGALGGLLFLAGGLATALMVLLPGEAGAHEAWALLLAAAAVVYGGACALVVPWQRLPPSAVHVATIACLPVIVLVGAWTGAEDSPLRLLVAFVPIWAACFQRPPVVVAYILAAAGTLFAPYLYDPAHAEAAAFLRSQLVLTVGVGAITLTIALLRRSLDRARRGAARVAAQQRALLRVATAIADGVGPDALLALVAEQAATVTGADDGAVLKVDGDDTVLVGMWADRPAPYQPGTRFPRSGTATERALLSGRPIQIRADRDTLSDVARHTGQGALAMAPVHLADRVWGLISVSVADPAGLAPRTAERLMDFAALVATAIVNAEQRDRLAAQAFADPLTGLANHRVFHERLATETERALRHGRALSLVVIDIDTFKSINDSAGHEVGDRVLAEVAARLQGTGRSGDLLARIGGDEFGWLLPETTAADALTVVERARAAVSAAPVGPGATITISAGICDLSEARDADELFRLADGALYWSKAHGRDAAHVYDPISVRELSPGERAEELGRHQALLGIRALARAIDAKDPTTQEHSGRVAELACALAKQRGWSEERVRLLEEAAIVHDVGKIAIGDAILLKRGRLTAKEYAEVRRHTALGAQIVEDVLTAEQVAWIRGHHERPDGQGYPDGLAGDAIPEGAALLGLADAYDAMTAARPYAAPMTHAAALAECRRLAGRQFTADAVAALGSLDPSPAVAA